MSSKRRTATNLPPTVKGLRAWLRASDEGRLLFSQLASEFLEEKCRSCEIRPFPKVLVVLRRLGNHPGAEVYAEEGVMLRMLEMPDIPDDARFGPLAEEWIEVNVPKNWRHLIGLPSKRIQSEVFRSVTVEEAAYCEDVLQAINQITKSR